MGNLHLREILTAPKMRERGAEVFNEVLDMGIRKRLIRDRSLRPDVAPWLGHFLFPSSFVASRYSS